MHRVYLAVEPIDFRKGISGIAALCQQQFRLNPLSGHYFVFRNRAKNAVKILYYDTQGFCLFHKRLSTGRFYGWPQHSQAVIALTPTQVSVLLANGQPESVVTAAPWKHVA